MPGLASHFTINFPLKLTKKLLAVTKPDYKCVISTTGETIEKLAQHQARKHKTIQFLITSADGSGGLRDLSIPLTKHPHQLHTKQHYQ